jgi:hypothetical protein
MVARVSTASWIVVSSLVFAVLLVGAGLSAAGTGPFGPIAFKGWDFSSSWASNLAVLGAILGTVLGKVTLPSTPVLMKHDAYISLSLFFGAVVVISPFLYTALRSGSATANGPSYTGADYRVFLVVCVLTIWAVAGQLGTLGCVLYELQHVDQLALGAVVPLFCTLGVAVAGAAWYVVATVKLVLESVKPAAPARVAPAAAPVASALL